ncbi:MAG TPA: hypothetical protein VEV38_05660, partial [Candidatus Eremiobacteraceae bacterium]|nr:hypothetical protein [Candidatus Eremiobacteraceae bacterium]
MPWFWDALSPSGASLPAIVKPAFAPFVGRAAELKALGDAIESLKSGFGDVIALEGARGSGKHRLLAELRSPMGAVEVEWQTASILALDNSVLNRGNDQGPRPPRVLIVEHTERASSHDASALRNIIRTARDDRTLLILLFETGVESRSSRDHEDTLIERASVRLALKPLADDEMRAILKRCCEDGAPVPSDVATACIELGGGNPGYLLEILTSLQSKRPTLPIARDEVDARTDGLLPFELRVLRAVSVAGTATARQLILMLRSNHDQTVEALQTLCDRGILASSDDGHGSTYRFARPLWRFVIYYDITADARTILHNAAVRYLSKRSDKRPAAMAEHLAHGGRTARAVGEAVSAIDIALRDRNYVEAARWSRYVLHFARDVDARLLARERLAVSLEMLGAGESAVLEYVNGLQEAQRNGRRADVDQFAEGLAVTQFVRGRSAEALDSLTRVLADRKGGSHPPPRLLALGAYLSVVSASKPDAWLSQLEGSDAAQITPSDLVRIHASRAFAFLHGGDVASAEREVQAGLVVGDGSEDPIVRIKAFELAGEIAASMGDMSRAVSFCTSAFACTADSSPAVLSISKVSQMAYLRRGAAANLAQYLALSGDVSHALEVCMTFRHAPYVAGDLTWVMLRFSEMFAEMLAGVEHPEVRDPGCSGTALLDVAIEWNQRTSISFAASALALRLYRAGDHGSARDVLHRGLESLTDCTDAWLLLTTAAQIGRPADFRRVRELASKGLLARTPFYRAVGSLTNALYDKRQHRASRRTSSDVALARDIFEQLGNIYLKNLCDACVRRP